MSDFCDYKISKGFYSSMLLIHKVVHGFCAPDGRAFVSLAALGSLQPQALKLGF